MIDLTLVSAKNVKRHLKISELKINHQLKDSWQKVEKNTISSHKKVLCSLKTNSKEYFLIFDSLFVQSNENQIVLFYNNSFDTFAQDDKNKTQLHSLNKKYKEIKKELLKTKFALYASNDIDLINRLEKLKRKAFKLKAQIYFSLFENEDLWK
ncbi:MSC_0621 family F1-like ATPase epsilon subunit [Mycoplasma sp. 4404]|uniref:MSC_0621 family F1-like ATPase epsilon subunit n=1 Tax=Mycoplasma sp. 4404 TaxID=3108530 RepID=UPI002B1D7CB6|nr:hypothetical protein [Mycoplasma sp. 4404]MEA4162635.1 hypothetical protein [Mycoplasma sp. 4404]